MMLENGGMLCPSCCTPFDKGKHRKLIDTCGHEICYMCINSDHCPLCVYHAQAQSLKQNYFSQDAGISRPRLKTNGHFTTYMQARDRLSPERPPPAGMLIPKAVPSLPNRTLSGYSPRLSRSSRNHRSMKWANGLDSESQAALSDDELQSNSKHSRDHDLYTRLGLLLGDRMPLSSSKSRACNHSSQESYASISSLASSEANTTNTSPLSTLTDSSDPDPLSCIGSLHAPSREQSSDSVVSLISSSTGHSSCSSPIGTQFQRHAPARTSDSFVQFAKRNLTRRRMHHRSDESALNLFPVGKNSNASKLLNKSLKPLYFEVPQAEPEPLFIGRQWLFKEIEQEITDSKSKKAIVIMGGPGSGKTAIVSQLLEYSSFRVKKDDAIYHDIQSLDGSDYNMSNSSSSDSGLYQSISTLHYSGARSLGSRLVAYHLCQADNYLTCLVPDFVHSIASYLCRAPHLTAYRDLVARNQRLQDLLSMPSCIADASASFIHGILEPLNSLRCQNRIPNTTCLLVVDGLNEAEYHRPEYGDTIASFLVHHFDAIPSWLKVIVTIRTTFGDLLKRLPSHCILLDKVSTSENIQKDLRNYILHRINTSSSIRANITVNNNKVEGSSNLRFASHLSNLSQGCILYIRLTLDLIEKGHLVVKSSSYRVLPVCLSEVYTLSFNLKFTTIKSYERIVPILQICLASLYPLTLQELFHTLCSKSVADGPSWDEFMSRMDTLISGHFIVTRQDGTVMFAHPSMREWLLRRDENESLKFLCDARAGHATIAFRMSRGIQQQTPDDCLELGHHVLKAHIYRTTPKDLITSCLPRDLQAYWVNLGSQCIESSLGSLRNIYSPNVKVS
ncbi:Protein TANC2, partial [Stegodyphus mimosarum]